MKFNTFEATPRILRQKTTTRISGKFYDIPRDIQNGYPVKLLLKYNTGSGVWEDGTVPSWAEEREFPCQFNEDASFAFDFTAPEEGEYTFHIYMQQEYDMILLAEFSCYALAEDLFELRPLKGDTHFHSSWSICAGIDQNPAFVSAVCRSRGLDFLFITDHNKQYPSRQAIQAMAPFESDFKVYPGEECHVPYRIQPDKSFLYNNSTLSGIHHVSLGAEKSVVEYADSHFEEYSQDIEKRMAALPADISADLRRQMAGVDWLVEKIHEFGGIAIFAHPFWKLFNHLNLPPAVREYIFDTGKFDAVEVIGLGSGNNDPTFHAGIVECIAWLHDKSIKAGKHIPVTGATDSHNAEDIAGYHCTLAFVKENTLENILTAIKNGKTLAYRRLPGENPFFWGEFRLVRYAEFLARDFFPEHDDICEVEGKLMLQVLRGEVSIESVKPVIKERTEKLFQRFWAD